MDKLSSSMDYKKFPNLKLIRQRKTVWWVSGIAILLSLLGFLFSSLDPSIHAPLRPGLDFTGGTQIQLERVCRDSCLSLKSESISESLLKISLPQDKGIAAPNLSSARVQLLDGSQSFVIRLPFLSAEQSKVLVAELVPIAGPFNPNAQAIDTIGPSLGGQLLRSSLVSLLVAFSGIAIYISFRFDRRYAMLALIALAHDVIIVSGIFAWLGLFMSVEVDSLFAVALLTIAGYSVNDTVVVFDRIRERRKVDSSLRLRDQIDQAVSSTLTRTIYTSASTLLPLVSLIIFGGITLFWFAVALALGVLIGSWSSIALAPTLLSLWEKPFSEHQTNLDVEEIN